MADQIMISRPFLTFSALPPEVIQVKPPKINMSKAKEPTTPKIALMIVPIRIWGEVQSGLPVGQRGLSRQVGQGVTASLAAKETASGAKIKKLNRKINNNFFMNLK